MGRRRRLLLQGATYHVYVRGNRRAAVFRSPEDYAAYVEDLRVLSERYGTRVLGFTLMPNHPHLALRTDGDPLNVFMQALTQRHALRYNRTYGVTGRLNESRYKSQVVDTGRYLVALVRYIHQNPVRAHLVARPDEWPYSSHLAYLGRAFPWVETREVLARIHGQEDYARLMHERLSEEEGKVFERPGVLKLPEGLADLALTRPRPFPQCARLRRAPAIPAQQALLQHAARAGVPVPVLVSDDRRRRTVAARGQIAAQMYAQGYRLHEIGLALGRQEAGVSRIIRQWRTSDESSRPGLATASSEQSFSVAESETGYGSFSRAA